jgi:hypothetical protein
MTANHIPAVNPLTGEAYKEVSVNVALSRELQATRAMRDAAIAANARLLAQRDELVAALQRCATALTLYGQPSAEGAVKQARTAIARAKGI